MSDLPSTPRYSDLDDLTVDPVTAPVTAPPRSTVPASTFGNGSPTDGPSSTTGVAADQAKQVTQDAVEGGKQVAGVAADQAKAVATEAAQQASSLLGEALTQLNDQASTQQNNLAAWLHSVVDELDQMVDHSRTEGQSGTATQLVSQVSQRARGAASWLSDNQPSDLLDQTTRFARQRPGLFIALAAAAGLLAGRLTRGLAADSGHQPATPDRLSNGSTPTFGSAPSVSRAPVVADVPAPAATAAPMVPATAPAGGSAAPEQNVVPRDGAPLFDDDLGVR